MPFESFTFWLTFFAFYLVFLVIQSRVRLRNALLLLGSYVFYAAFGGAFLALLIFSTVATFLMALALSSSTRKRPILVLGLVFHVGMLFAFKYSSFLVGTFGSSFGSWLDWPTLHLVLPLGLSFYTFQAIGYLIDVARGRSQASRNLLDFALFMAFFPKVVAGPIERAPHLLPQFAERRPITGRHVSEGAFLIVWGLIQKTVIAANAAQLANDVFARPGGLNFTVVLAAFAFALQIYADFSGYSDIARGLASLMGFDLVWNFDTPYFSATPSEFWQRWHMSLSQWFREYVYFPLGGNRRGEFRTLCNLLIVMVLVGLWHGAGWTYIVWGLYWGVLLILYRLWELHGPARLHRSRNLLLRALAIALMFMLTTFGWVIFRSDSLGTSQQFLAEMSLTLANGTTHWYVLLLWCPILIVDSMKTLLKDRLFIAHAPVPVQYAFYLTAAYALMLLSPLEVQHFIYAQF